MTTQPNNLLRVIRQLALLLTVLAMLPVAATGRENIVTGGLAVRQGYDSNIHRTDENHVLQWVTTIIPSLDFVSQGQTDRLALTYAPSLQVIDHESAEAGVDKPSDFSDQTINHELTVTADKTWNKDLQLLFAETYVKSDDPDLRPRPMWETGSGLYVSERLARRRYWTNAASLGMQYTYTQQSFLAIRYENSRLQNEDERLAGSFDRHYPTITIDHRFNEQWRTVVGYGYTKANFQQAEDPLLDSATNDDLVIHNPTLEIDYTPWLHATAFGTYSFQKYDYQDSILAGYNVNDSKLGWRQELGSHSTATLAAGYSQINWDAGGSEDALSYEGHIATTMGQTTLACGAEKGFDVRYFDGTGSGLSKYWLLQAALTYQFDQNLTADLASSYREDNFLEARQGIEEDVLEATTGFSYRLSRWAILSLHYIFRNYDTTAVSSDTNGDYDDHRLFLELKTTKELWRW